MADLKVAALVTEYFRGSHADVLVTKILEGYDLYGERTNSRISLASMYLEQADEEDIGVGLAQKHGVPMFESIGEALAVGGTGINVDGVVLIGEHGHYYENELGQQTLPAPALLRGGDRGDGLGREVSCRSSTTSTSTSSSSTPNG